MGFPVKICMIAAVLLCSTVVASQNLENFNATYGPFNSSYNKEFHFENPASITDSALQLTPVFGVYGQPIENNASGRVMLNKRFKFWEQGFKNSDKVASFNSSFLFNINPQLSTNRGEGLAFVLAPDIYLPSDSFGQYLGLTNATTNGSPKNKFVAIEFDDVKQEFDPDDNHVGLNINSIVSTVNASLTPLGIKIASGVTEAMPYINVWVEYNGVKKVIEVYVARQAEIEAETPSRPDTPVLSYGLDLREDLNQYSYFGFSASTGSGVQLNTVFRWNLTVDSYPDNAPAQVEAPAPAPAPAQQDKHLPWKKILVGVGVPLALLVVGAAVTGYYYLRKKRSIVQPKSNLLIGALKRLPGTPREFKFKDLKKATDNFNEKKKLGQGGFGVVYRGHLQNENLEVAVKQFSRETIKGQDDFLAELTIINRLRHKHLVPLLGWCHKKGKLLLVYDYMPNGSLDAHLFTTSSDNKLLSWELRYKIIAGVASALHYLHNEYDQRVVHRDLKASNIMLDSDFNARLGDFGLARALDKEKASYTEAEGVAGTLGYIAPECFLTAKATQQSDVYAFGAVLLEIVCGLRPGTRIGDFQYLVDWVWSLHREGRILDAVEEQLGDEYIVEEAQKMLILALACSHPIAGERPKTQAIVQIISGSIPVPYVLPFKPAFVWPSMPVVEADDIGSLAYNTAETKSFPMTHLGSGFTSQCTSPKLYTSDKLDIV